MGCVRSAGVVIKAAFGRHSLASMAECSINLAANEQRRDPDRFDVAQGQEFRSGQVSAISKLSAFVVCRRLPFCTEANSAAAFEKLFQA
jgi:hypothetical protein